MSTIFPFFNNDNNKITINATQIKENLDQEDCYIPDQFKDKVKESNGIDAFKYIKCDKRIKPKQTKEYTQVNIDGMTQYSVVPTGLAPPFNSRITTITKDAKIIIPNGMNTTIIKQTIHKDDSKNLAVVMKDATKQDKGSIEVMPANNIQLYGGGDGYYKKYLKYKSKYIALKNSLVS
jgi:hypothetical protein